MASVAGRCAPAAVASLLAILTGLVGPALYARQAVVWRKATDDREIGNVRAIAAAARTYANEHGGAYPPDLATMLEQKFITPQTLLPPYNATAPLTDDVAALRAKFSPEQVYGTVDAHSDYQYLAGDVKVPAGGDVPKAIIVGDSTQAVYAGNYYCAAPRPRSWFNAATGYGALGFAPPAAIGAALAEPDAPIICLVGDGGLQFSLSEIGSAADAGARVIFLVWNNDGYQEIENFMIDAGITPEGVKPSAPDFIAIGTAYGVPSERLADVKDLPAALERAGGRKGPSLVEIHQTKTVGATA